MSYHPRVSLEQPLKTNHKINKPRVQNTSYLKSFKKSADNILLCKARSESYQQSYCSDENEITPRLEEKKPVTSKSKGLQQLQFMMSKNENSMEELLNSSINQFEKLIMYEESAQSLQQQNFRLKGALAKMKIILKQKLQTALQKQKSELSKMLQDYISLITKLLQDKEQLTIKVQQLIDENQKDRQQLENDYNTKLRQAAQERQEQIGTTKNQIQQFFNIIQEYEEESKKEQLKIHEMEKKIQVLEREKEVLIQQIQRQDGKYVGDEEKGQLAFRIQAQSTKIQTLLELLDKSQAENNDLRIEINQLKSKDSSQNGMAQIKQIRQSYEKKIYEMEQQHEQEFFEYEKAIKDTLAKKDQCIERLNLIIQGLRQRKCPR